VRGHAKDASKRESASILGTHAQRERETDRHTHTHTNTGKGTGGGKSSGGKAVGAGGRGGRLSGGAAKEKLRGLYRSFRHGSGVNALDDVSLAALLQVFRRRIHVRRRIHA